MPRISVIMPVYNSGKYVGDAIQSILDQTYKDFELIVIDDGSKDNSREIIESFHDERIVHITNSPNIGFLPSLNYGMSIAKGEFIARLDDDDISYPTRFAKQVNYLDDNPDIVLLGTHRENLLNGEKQSVKLHPIIGTNEIKFSLLFGNYCISHSSFMMRRIVIEQNGIKYEKYLQTPDHNMLLTMSEQGQVDMLTEPLVAWRIHNQQSTQIRTTRMKMHEEDNVRCEHINKLNLDSTQQKALKLGVCRQLVTNIEYKEFTTVFTQYGEQCKVEHDSQCMKFLYQDILTQQRHTPVLLGNYLKSPYRDNKWLKSKQGLIFVVKCIISYNANYVTSECTL